MNRFFSVLVFFAAFVAPWSTQAAIESTALPAGVTLATSVEGITEYDLPNGLRVLLAPDASKPTITVNTTYMVGSRHENYGETGMAHLLEHLMFKGTPTYPLALAEMQKRGMRMNGTTWVDRTNYFASFAANDDDLDWYLSWSADAMVNSFIARKDLDSEMTVVRNEMERGENDPGSALYTKTLVASFMWHSYGKNTIGARSDVENVSIERLQAFYRKYYQPDNAVLVVTGKFDEAKTLKRIAELFGKIARPSRVIEATYTLDPAQDGEKTVTVHRVGDTQIVIAMYHIPAGASADFAAVRVLAEVLGDTPSGRLHKALVEKKLAAWVFSFPFRTMEPGVVTFGAQMPTSASLADARAELLKVLDGVSHQAVTEEETTRAKQKLLKDIELTVVDPEKLGIALSGAIALGDWRLLFLGRDQIRAVKAADVQRVAEAYLVPDNRTLGLFIPTEKPKRAPAPAKVDVQPLVAGYKGDAALAAGEAFDATPANIDARSEHSTLGNGMKLVMLTKSTRGAMVHLDMNLHYGSLETLAGKTTAASTALRMLNRGAAGLTRAQIKDAFDGMKAEFSVSGGAFGAGIRLKVPRENLAAALRLMAKILRQPSFPETEFEQLRQETLTAIESQRKEPQALAGLLALRHGNPYAKTDVRYAPDFDEQIADIKAVKLAEARAFHQDYLGADHGEVAVVGDFDSKATRALLEELFGDWKAKQSYARVAKPHYEVSPLVLKTETPDKANAMYAALLRLPMQDTDADYPALIMANYLLGGGPASRFWQRVREKEGLSYGVGSSFSASSFEKRASWFSYAIFAPQNLDKVNTALAEEIARARKEGFTAEELAKGKTALLQQRRLRRAQDDGLAGTLSDNEELGRRMAFSQAIDDKLAALSLEAVNAALRNYIEPTKLVVSYAGDFAKAAAK